MKVLKLEKYVEPVKRATIPDMPIGSGRVVIKLNNGGHISMPANKSTCPIIKYVIDNLPYPSQVNQFDPHSDVEWHMMTDKEIQINLQVQQEQLTESKKCLNDLNDLNRERMEQMLKAVRGYGYNYQQSQQYAMEQEMIRLKQEAMMEQMVHIHPLRFTPLQREQLHAMVKLATDMYNAPSPG